MYSHYDDRSDVFWKTSEAYRSFPSFTIFTSIEILRTMSIFTSAKSVRSEIINSWLGFPKNVGYIPLAVVMTTANGMHPAFSRRHTQLFIISDLYRS